MTSNEGYNKVTQNLVYNESYNTIEYPDNTKLHTIQKKYPKNRVGPEWNVLIHCTVLIRSFNTRTMHCTVTGMKPTDRN